MKREPVKRDEARGKTDSSTRDGANVPPLETLLSKGAARDPRAWEAMLNLNRMRAAQRRRTQEDRPPAAGPAPCGTGRAR